MGKKEGRLKEKLALAWAENEGLRLQLASAQAEIEKLKTKKVEPVVKRMTKKPVRKRA